MATPIKDIEKFEAGQIFISDTEGTGIIIEIMAVVDGFVMARNKEAYPFVYTIKQMRGTFSTFYLK